MAAKIVAFACHVLAVVVWERSCLAEQWTTLDDVRRQEDKLKEEFLAKRNRRSISI